MQRPIVLFTRNRNVCSGLFVYEVTCSRGQERRREGATPASISMFDSYDMKTLGFKFGYDIFAGFKMPTL